MFEVIGTDKKPIDRKTVAWNWDYPVLELDIRA